ncbi:YdeI/OmpD-associated family protein [Patescibacteria group bacterium]|nr:YdeI/OmpD-associated family protein [Patescibacteria group bacterium]
MQIPILAGTLHELPSDLQEMLLLSPEITEKWNTLTPLARNEWICRVTIVKKDETRKDHIKRLLEDI